MTWAAQRDDGGGKGKGGASTIWRRDWPVLPPLCPLSGTSPPQGGRGVQVAMPAFLSFRTGCGATETRSPPCPRSASSLLPTTLNRHPARRPSPPPERSAERGPIRSQSGSDGKRGDRVPVRSTDGGSLHARRYCQEPSHPPGLPMDPRSKPGTTPEWETRPE